VAAEKQNMTVLSAAVSSNLDSLSDAIVKVKDSQYRYICLLASDQHIEAIFEEALRLKMLGKEYLYVLHGVDPAIFDQKMYYTGRDDGSSTAGRFKNERKSLTAPHYFVAF
jgi:hypothetical protein